MMKMANKEAPTPTPDEANSETERGTLPNIAAEKGHFATDAIDEFVTKGDRMRKKREEATGMGAKTKSTPVGKQGDSVTPKEVPTAPKFINKASPHQKSNLVPKTDKLTVEAGATHNNFLGSDMILQDPLEGSPSKLRAASADKRGKARPAAKPTTGSPYVQQQVMKAPSPRQGDASGSKQYL